MAIKLPFDPDTPGKPRSSYIDDPSGTNLLYQPEKKWAPRSQYVFQIRTDRETYTLIAKDLKEALDLFLEKSRYEPISIIQQQRIDYPAT